MYNWDSFVKSRVNRHDMYTFSLIMLVIYTFKHMLFKICIVATTNLSSKQLINWIYFIIYSFPKANTWFIVAELKKKYNSNWGAQWKNESKSHYLVYYLDLVFSTEPFNCHNNYHTMKVSSISSPACCLASVRFAEPVDWNPDNCLLTSATKLPVGWRISRMALSYLGLHLDP